MDATPNAHLPGVPTRACLQGRFRAYALTLDYPYGARHAAQIAARLGFDSLLIRHASLDDPSGQTGLADFLHDLAPSARDHGLQLMAEIRLDSAGGRHELTTNIAGCAFTAEMERRPGPIDPRLPFERTRGPVRLRNPLDPALVAWWHGELEALAERGINRFVALDPTEQGMELADALAGTGRDCIVAFTAPRDIASLNDPDSKVLAACWLVDSEYALQNLARVALHASGWALAAGRETGLETAVRTVNSLLPLTPEGRRAPRQWTSAAAQLQIIGRRHGDDGLVLVSNVSNEPAPWPPAAMPPFPWQELQPLPGFPQLGSIVAPGSAHLLHATPLPAAPRAAPPSAENAAASPRIIISRLSPSVDLGAFAVKRVIGDALHVEADIFADGHEQLAADLLIRASGETGWQRHHMKPLGNDVWCAYAPLRRLGRYEFRVEAWLDRWGGLVHDIVKKQEAGQPISLELLEAATHLENLPPPQSAADAATLQDAIRALRDGTSPMQHLQDPALRAAVAANADREFAVTSFTQPVDVDREAARFSSWYELFPRSQSPVPGQAGGFRDVIERIPHIAGMGFDTLYFPPIHPIGTTNRKGRNNALKAAEGDVGSPYAIGSPDGGHDAIHPDLGSLDDFRALLAAAGAAGLEVALDFAIQCSPDHPWLREHPAWFAWRPDGSLKYAENPPKKYEDIVNVDFYAPASVPALWEALRDVILLWVGEGVRAIRVDNPHTKPLPFWQWLIADIKARYPDTIFLSEAFTRPNLMRHLAKLGFSQSYTYFTWRNDKRALTEYMTELAGTDAADYFRPHFFVNTPDINPTFLHSSGRAGFLIRAALAATLSGLWGVYAGFELCESAPLPGREEYLDSEKYELRQRPDRVPGDIVDAIGQLNRLRRAEPALQHLQTLEFLNAWNDNIIYYCKYCKSLAGETYRVLVAVSLDPHAPQEADFEVPLWQFGLSDSAAIGVRDLLTGWDFIWQGKVQHMRLTPENPYAIWRIQPTTSGR